MSGENVLVQLEPKRVERDLRAALAALDEAARAEHIDPTGYLGKYHSGVMLLLERGLIFLTEQHGRIFATQAAHEARMQQIFDREEGIALRRDETAKAQLKQIEVIAAAVETKVRQLELKVEDNAMALVARLANQLEAKIAETNIVRVKAVTRRLKVKDLATIACVVIGIFATGMLVGALWQHSSQEVAAVVEE